MKINLHTLKRRPIGTMRNQNTGEVSRAYATPSGIKVEHLQENRHTREDYRSDNYLDGGDMQ